MRKYPNESILALRSLGGTRLLLTKPAVMAELLVQHPDDFVKPPALRDVLGMFIGESGLILAEHEQHRFMRKKSQPAFNFRAIKDMYPMMWKKAWSFTNVLAEDIRCSDGEADLDPWSTRVSLDIIGVAGLGRNFDTLRNSDNQLLQDYQWICEPTVGRVAYYLLCMQLSYRVVQMLPLWRPNRAFRERTQSLRRTVDDLVRDKREAVVKDGDQDVDILSMLIKTDQFTDAELSDQLLTYLSAG